MKIAILSPAGAMHRYSGSFKKAIHYAPLTMTTIASILEGYDNVHIEIYDETIESIPLDLEVDVIFMTVITGTAPRCYAFADYYRKRGVTLILGGVHATLCPEEAKNHADTVVLGYGEVVIPKMMIDLRNNALKAYYRSDSQIDFRFARPSRRYLSKDKYITNNSIEASRGCSNDCSFCVVSALHQNHVHKKDLRQLVEEIEGLNSKIILFVDVNLIADRAFAIELFIALTPLKKWWYGLATADVVKDKVLFDLMVKSGCKGLLIGFESVTVGGLAAMNKYRNNVVDYGELMKAMHANGIQVNGTFCFGTDDDDETVFDRTVEMVEQLKIDLPRYSILTPFPTTPLYDQLTREKRITDDHWSMYDVQHVVYQPKKMTQAQLMAGFIEAWRSTYSLGGIMTRIGRPHLTFPLSILTNKAYSHYADKLEVFDRNRMIDNSDITGNLNL